MAGTTTVKQAAPPATDGGLPADPPPAAGRWTMAQVLLCTAPAVLTTFIVLLVHRLSPRTLLSAHGLLHSAVADRFVSGAALGLPPGNPFFAGEPLPYYWVFHYVGAAVSGLLGVHPLFAFEFMIIAGAWLIWFAAGAFGRRMYGSVVPGLAIGFLAFAGANAIGPWVLAARTAAGGQLPADNPDYLWGIAHPIVGRLGLEDPYSLYQPLLFFFFNVTSRPVALALLFAAAAALLAWLHTGRAIALAGLVLLTAGATAMSPLIGGAAAGALVCGVAAAWLLRRHPTAAGERDIWPERYVHAAGGLIAGVLLAAPSAYHLTRLGGGITVAPSLSALIAVGSSSFALVVLAAIALWRTSGPWRRYLVVLSVAAGVLLLANVLLVLPAGNHTNFFHAAAVLLPIVAVSAVVPAGGVRNRRWHRAVWGLMLFVPAPALIVYGFMGRAPIPVEFDGTAMRRTPADAPDAMMYAWMSRSTEPYAVFVTDPAPPIQTVVGNMPELPALGGRDLFTAHATSYMVTPNVEASQRHEIALRLQQGLPLVTDQAALIARLGRPVYIVTRRAHEARLLATLQDRYGEPRFQAGEWAVFRLPDHSAAPAASPGTNTPE